MIKILKKLRIEGIYLSTITDKPTTSITLNSKKWRDFPLITRNKTRMPTLALNRAGCPRQSKKARKRRPPNQKGRGVLVPVYPQYDLLCTENPKDSN